MKKLFFVLFASFFSHYLMAMEVTVGPVQIKSLSLVVVAHLGHSAGNFELVLEGGFTPPAGMDCEPTYITTKKVVDPDNILFPLLASAYLSRQPIKIRVTDDPAYRAWGRRCSLIGASVGTF